MSGCAGGRPFQMCIRDRLADPLEGLLGAQFVVGKALLVLPVGGDAVLRGVVHLPGADLHLEGDALPADDGGVEGLVAVGLGGGDIVLEPAQHGVEQLSLIHI